MKWHYTTEVGNDWKTVSDGADVTFCGRVFNSRKAQSLMVEALSSRQSVSDVVCSNTWLLRTASEVCDLIAVPNVLEVSIWRADVVVACRAAEIPNAPMTDSGDQAGRLRADADWACEACAFVIFVCNMVQHYVASELMLLPCFAALRSAYCT